ncbi:hypothetical protein D3C87_2183840 [compost metagenome]
MQLIKLHKRLLPKLSLKRCSRSKKLLRPRLMPLLLPRLLLRLRLQLLRLMTFKTKKRNWKA